MMAGQPQTLTNTSGLNYPAHFADAPRRRQKASRLLQNRQRLRGGRKEQWEAGEMPTREELPSLPP